MKKIKIYHNFFSQKKKKVMDMYQISEEEYKYIYNQGHPKDENGQPLHEFEVEIPDSVPADIAGKDIVTANSQNQKNKSSQSSGGSKLPANANVSSEMISREQTFNQQIVHDYMSQAHHYLDLALKCKQNPDCNPEEYAAYIAMSREAEEKAERYYQASNTPAWHETNVTTVFNVSNGTVSTQSKMVNTPLAKFTSGLCAIQDVINVLANTLDAFSSISGLIKSRNKKK